MDRRLAVALTAVLLVVPGSVRAGDDPVPEEGAPADAAPSVKSSAPPAKKDGAGEDAPAKGAAGEGGARKKAPAADEPLVRRRTPRDRAEALRILESVTVNVNFEGTRIRDVVRHLSASSGVNILLGPALEKEMDVDLVTVDLRLRRATVRQVLDLVARSRSLALGFRDGIVLLTTAKEARGKPILRLYTVADLAMKIRDFPAPDLMLRPAGAEVEPVEETERAGAFSDPDDILNLVRDNTGTGTWEEEGISGDVLRDWLVIRQYADVHEEIAELLTRLRAHR